MLRIHLVADSLRSFCVIHVLASKLAFRLCVCMSMFDLHVLKQHEAQAATMCSCWFGTRKISQFDGSRQFFLPVLL